MALAQVTSIAISQQHVSLLDHTDVSSLDVLLRAHATNNDTTQATELVIEQLITSGYFEPTMIPSNTGSGHMVRGLQLI